MGGGRDARLVRVDLWDGGRLEGAVSATVRTAEEAAQTYPIISKIERDVGGQEGQQILVGQRCGGRERVHEGVILEHARRIVLVHSGGVVLENACGVVFEQARRVVRKNPYVTRG